MDKLEELSSKEFCALMAIRANCGLSTSAKQTQLLHYLAKKNQVRIILDNFFRPIGYIAWSRITSDTLRLIPALQGQIKYPYERIDGYLYWIDDVVIDPRFRELGRQRWLRFLKKRRFFAYTRKDRIYISTRKRKKHKLLQMRLNKENI